MSNRKQWLGGVGLVLGLAVVFFAGSLALLLLAAAVLAAAGGWWLRRKHIGVRAFVAQNWRVAAGMGAMAVVLGLALFSGIFAQQALNPAIGPCSAAMRQAPSQPSAPAAAPASAQDYFDLGKAEYDRGECEQAIAAYSQAIQLDPRFAEAYNNRAYTYMVKHDYASALPDLDQAIQLRPDYINALINRGDIYNYYYNIDRPRALLDYDHVLRLNAQDTSVAGHHAMARLYQGDFLGFIAELAGPLK